MAGQMKHRISFAVQLCTKAEKKSELKSYSLN